MSTKCTLVDVFATEPIGGAEPSDLALDPPLLLLQPGKRGIVARQRAQIRGDHGAHRTAALGCLDPRHPIDVLGNRDRDVLHSFTVSQCHEIVTREDQTRLRPRVPAAASYPSVLPPRSVRMVEGQRHECCWSIPRRT